MSSIMDELRRLQGRRTPTTSAAAPPPELPPAPAQTDPVRRQAQVSPKHAISILAFALVGLIAVLVLPTLGGSRQRTAGKAGPAPEVVLEQAEEQPNAERGVLTTAGVPAEPSDEQETPPPDAPESDGGRPDEASAEPAAIFDPIEALPEPAFLLAAAAGRAPNTETTVEHAQAESSEAEDPASPPLSRVPFEPLTEPRFDLAGVQPVTGNTEDQGEPASAEVTAPAEETPAGTLEGTVTDPVRGLTQDKDEANRAAIRSLTVRAILGDENGIVVYTSAGPLRPGSRFHGMDVKEVTTRSVVFECGNKRYRWCLPSRASGRGGHEETS